MDDFTGVSKIIESTDSITKEFRLIIYDFLSPVAKESGNYIADRIKYLRVNNCIKALVKSKKILSDYEVTDYIIETRNLFPLIEKCSIESTEELVDKWANLIASAAIDKNFSPSYINLLSSLSPIESLTLDVIATSDIKACKMGIYQYYGISLIKLIQEVQCVRADMVEILSNLERLGLIIKVFEHEPGITFGNPPIGTTQEEMIGLTPLGGRFMLSCDRKLEIGGGIPHIDFESL